MNRHLQAKEAYERGEYERALNIVNDLLDENPNDAPALFLFGGIMIQTAKKGLAYNAFARCAKLTPDRPEVWVNFARCQTDDEEGWKATRWCLEKALELHPNSLAAMANMASLELQMCNPEAGLEWVNKALEIDPDYVVGQSTKGFACLMLQDWEEGWKNYHSMVGHASRPDIQYGDLPMWDGTPGMTVIVNGEQGIGDELIYSSIFEDMAKNCKYVIYDGMPRLKGLMERSLPDNVIVAGSRWQAELALPAHIEPEAYITQAGALQYYRKKNEDFPGTPYLKADEDMRKAVRGLLDSMGSNLKVGIAWTGGTKQSRKQFRQKTLESMTTLLRTDGVDWISLQYNDPSEEIAEFEQSRGIKVHHFPWITEIKDYDLTAALVSELDLVIAVPTSVTQLAGALGKDAWVMVPKITGWLFHPKNYVWANSVKLYRDIGIKDLTRAFKKWKLSKQELKKAS